jgi:predicted DNA-binding transcriptional regulator AlpA
MSTDKQQYGKRIKMPDGSLIITPWLTAEESAYYCSYSRSTFDRKVKYSSLPHGGDNGGRRYHVAVIDAWLKGDE